LKRTLLKGLFEPFTPFSFVLIPPCLAVSINITHIIWAINLWHGNSLILISSYKEVSLTLTRRNNMKKHSQKKATFTAFELLSLLSLTLAVFADVEKKCPGRL
jgi:glutamate mutase epsilon subunit